MLPPIRTDFIVIGGGVAGLRAAIGLANYGEVIVLNKGLAAESTSAFAQGGIAAAMGEEEDARQSHLQDTLAAGCGLCRVDAVKTLVDEGPARVRELIAWGAKFDQVNGSFALAQEAAHSHRRILRARGDATGVEIVRTLARAVGETPRIRTFDGHFAIDLLTRRQKGRTICFGVFVLDERQGEARFFLARGVFLATGGAGQIYRRTTNPAVATGDGIAMALRAGARVEDMEFFQFHPTALSLPNAPSFLLSEAMRGEGGILRNAAGRPFLRQGGELAPRDVVTRAILDEMRRSRATHVWLDVTHLPADFLRGRFPQIYATCLRYGMDITREPIPVAPSAHYLMGGVRCDIDGCTDIENLWTAGETACTGVHGANRLASNSLLEGLVFGARAAESAGRRSDRQPQPEVAPPRPPRFFPHRPLSDYLLIQKELRDVMWNDVGIRRNRTSLRRARAHFGKWIWAAKRLTLDRTALETRNMILIAAAIVEATHRRRGSLGAHFRSDDRGAAARLEHIFFRQVAIGDDFPVFSDDT